MNHAVLETQTLCAMLTVSRRLGPLSNSSTLLSEVALTFLTSFSSFLLNATFFRNGFAFALSEAYAPAIALCGKVWALERFAEGLNDPIFCSYYRRSNLQRIHFHPFSS